MALDTLDRAIINRLQKGFPVCERPYEKAAEELGTTEGELIRRLERLLADKVLTRFGPLFHAEKLGGGLTLAALAVPEDRFEAVTQVVNAFPQVAHNYQREHRLNMWFVLATETPEEINTTLAAIEAATGLTVYNMPKHEEYFVGLYFPV